MAFAKLPFPAFPLDAETRCAIHHKHELVAVLVVPLALSSHLTGRHDALDAQARALDKQVDDLIWQGPSR